MLSKEQRNELDTLAKPICEWLVKNIHPNTRVIIDPESCELIETVYNNPLLNPDPYA